MQLKSLMVDTKSAWVSYPGLDGFEIEIANLGREKVVALRKSCTETKIDRKSRIPMEELNEKKFVRKFTEETIKNWRGLKLSYLEGLMLVDISAENPDTELPYSTDNAELLVTQSTEFDNWLNEAVFDLENFRSKRDRGTVEATEQVAD